MIARPLHVPAPPAVGEPLLIRVPTNGDRLRARRGTRTVLRQLIAAWSDDTSAACALRETPRGPVWDGGHAGQPVAFSISYTDSDAWIGVSRRGAIGIDAMCCAPFPDMADVARLYLGPASAERIRLSADPARAFAAEWTALEARLKCAGRPLTEWSEHEPGRGGDALAVRRYCDRRTVVTMCVDPDRSAS